jgi:hypothetical protein
MSTGQKLQVVITGDKLIVRHPCSVLLSKVIVFRSTFITDSQNRKSK